MLQRYNKKMKQQKKLITIFMIFRFISLRSHYVFAHLMQLLIINVLWFSLYCKPSKSGINDELKNICEVEHTRHRAMHNFVMNLISALAAYCFFDKKPAIRFDMEKPTGQLSLCY